MSLLKATALVGNSWHVHHTLGSRQQAKYFPRVNRDSHRKPHKGRRCCPRVTDEGTKV